MTRGMDAMDAVDEAVWRKPIRVHIGSIQGLNAGKKRVTLLNEQQQQHVETNSCKQITSRAVSDTGAASPLPPRPNATQRPDYG